jgi:hypothetical protein
MAKSFYRNQSKGLSHDFAVNDFEENIWVS